MYTVSIYKKHLTLSQRIKIEQGLNNNDSFRKIARDISKAHNTIAREVKTRRIKQKGNSFNMSIMECPLTKNAPFVCNACSNIKKCRFNKYFYFSKDANDSYKETLVQSRLGIDQDCVDFKRLNSLVTNEVSKGHSFSLILMNHPELDISERTLYNYQELGYLSTKNIDLPRKVRYKKRKRTTPKRHKEQDSCRNGRTYGDFKQYLLDHNTDFYAQMDTVEGIKGHSAFLTLYIVTFKLLLIFKIEKLTTDAVCDALSQLKLKLGYELFHKLFPIILTDNGTEFKNPKKIEDNGKHVYPTKLFYCEPRRSGRKGSIEVVHEYIRRYIPKGIDIDPYTPEQIREITNHINNVKRQSLDQKTPYELVEKYIGEENTKKLELHYIPPTEVILNSSLLYKNK